MTNSIFGWSYPPGVSSLPWDEDCPCEVCGEFEDTCICPECHECGAYGDPSCYINHGLKRTEQQRFYLECNERDWAEANEQENEMWDDIYNEERST